MFTGQVWKNHFENPTFIARIKAIALIEMTSGMREWSARKTENQGEAYDNRLVKK